jgi:uroporphyrinogen decarboxylase
MLKEERVLKTINKEEIDYLPSQITFSDRTRLKKLGKIMGFATENEFEEYLQNHIFFTYTTNNMPLFNRNDEKIMKEVEEMGFVRIDWKNGVVYDEWGVGIEMYSDGIFPAYHPLQSGKEGNKNLVEKFLPDDLKGGSIFKSDEEAIKNYKTPDPNREGNFYYVKKDLEKHSGDYLVLTSGYGGIYERAYFLTGYEEFMTMLASNPVLISGLLEKITDYKIEIARNLIDIGFKAGHNGDDLGSQYGPMISLDMFRKYLKPHIKRLWGTYKDAGVPVIFHSCGNITQFIPDLIEIGLDVLEPVQPVMDLEYIKKEFGKDITFWGGIDTQMLLPYGKPEEVREMASNSIRTLGKGGGHIIAPAQEVMKDVPIENVQALVETINTERQNVL